MRRVRRLLVGLLLIAAFAPTGAGAVGRARALKGVFARTFPQYYQGNSVALGPGGIPWFGLESEAGPAAIANVTERSLSLMPVATEGGRGLTTALQFDPVGSLWFGLWDGASVAIARRAPDGAVSLTDLPGTELVAALAIGADGQVWFTRGSYWGAAKVGWISATGAVTEIALPSESWPASIAVGPDGAAWFTETRAGQIGRVTTGGEVQLFPAGAGVEPRQIAVGPDGAMWFSENGEPGPHRTWRDRIARITTSGGQVTQFPIRFGRATTALAADPRGFIWFGTEEGEISSISPSGAVGGRGCVAYCGVPIDGLTPTPNHSVWFALGSASCSNCGGGAALMAQIAGTTVGKIPAGTLKLP